MAYVPRHKRANNSRSNTQGKWQHGNDSQSGSLRAQTKKENRQPKEAINDHRAKLFCTAFSRICCINLEDRPDKWDRFEREMQRVPGLTEKVERFNAVNGTQLMDKEQSTDKNSLMSDDITLQWDTTRNAVWDRHIEPGIQTLSPGEIGCALSHIALWRQLATSSASTMLVFEDDAAIVKSAPRHHSGRYGGRRQAAEKFLIAFEKAWSMISEQAWDLLYLGFSDRGERRDVTNSTNDSDELVVQLFRPAYGFHTHCYALTNPAANRLLSELPVTGPIDVWLADNQWFGMNVYCASVANEGWKNTGRNLVHQDRSKQNQSDITQSGRT